MTLLAIVPEQYREDIQFGLTNCDLLLFLINDIIDYNLVKEGRFKLRPDRFNLPYLVKEVF